jgi:hypothetical protein
MSCRGPNDHVHEASTGQRVLEMKNHKMVNRPINQATKGARQRETNRRVRNGCRGPDDHEALMGGECLRNQES